MSEVTEMLTENGITIDPEALEGVLRNADVLAIGFTLFPERLLVDVRSRADEGPLVTIVEPVSSVQERYLWLGRHRGSFGMPEAFSFFTWPGTVGTMVERDILARMSTRLREAGAEGEAALENALEALLELERSAFRDAVRGEGLWQPLWQAAEPSR